MTWSLLDGSLHNVCIIRKITNYNDRKCIFLRLTGKICFLPFPEMSVMKTYREGAAGMRASPGISWNQVSEQHLLAWVESKKWWQRILGQWTVDWGGWCWAGTQSWDRECQSWLNERMRLHQAEKWSVAFYTIAQHLLIWTVYQNLQGMLLEIHIPIHYLWGPWFRRSRVRCKHQYFIRFSHDFDDAYLHARIWELPVKLYPFWQAN